MAAFVAAFVAELLGRLLHIAGETWPGAAVGLPSASEHIHTKDQGQCRLLNY